MNDSFAGSIDLKESVKAKNINDSSLGNTVKMKFRVIDVSSEQETNSVYEIGKESVNSTGWSSARFCSYPQDIVLQMNTPIYLRQINYLSHESRISSQIDVFIYYPSKSGESQLKKVIPSNLIFEPKGYFNLDSNEKNFHQARELKKVYINNVPCMYLKLSLKRSYANRSNLFNQVGIISVECLGSAIENALTDPVNLVESLNGPINNEDDEMDEISNEKLRLYKDKLSEAVAIEDYDEASRIKKTMDRIRATGKRIFEFETKKKFYIKNEDFDNAKIMKTEADRLRQTIRNMEKPIPKITGFRDNESNNYTARASKLTNMVHLNNSSNNVNNLGDDVDNNLENMSLSEQSFQQTNFIANRNNKTDRESFRNQIVNLNLRDQDERQEVIAHDEQVIPALRNKSKQVKDDENEDVVKGELEDIDKSLRTLFEPLLKHITEEDMKKLLSKQILYREEGLEIFNTKLVNIFNDSSTIGPNVNLVMKMLIAQLNEKHPQIGIRTIEVFQNFLNQINKLKDKPSGYDYNLTDTLLLKIKEKVGDPNTKLRKRAVELYSFMLKQEFCDYNNLISELVDGEAQQFSTELNMIENRKMVKSSKIVLGKLEIFETIFKEFDSAVKDKRTELGTFPFKSVLKYICQNIAHPKSEVRKFAREVVIQTYVKFGYKKLEPFLKKVDIKELEKISNEIKEIRDFIDEQRRKEVISKKGHSRNKSKDAVSSSDSKSMRSSSGKKGLDKCPHCKRPDDKFKIKDNLETHLNKDCLLHTSCIKCQTNVHIKNLINHLLLQCDKKAYKPCSKCGDAIEIENFESHTKEGKCLPLKSKNQGRCPLCKKEIVVGERGLIQHMTEEGCPKQKRKDKYFSSSKSK